MPSLPRHLAVWALLALAALPGCTLPPYYGPQPAAPRSAAPSYDLMNFTREATFFYLEPSEEKFASLQEQANLLSLRLKDAGGNAQLLVAVQIARISQKHGWPIREGAFAKDAREILEGKSDLARYVADDEVVDPGKLDIWWADFFATGEEGYLEKIYAQAGWQLPKDDLNMILVTSAATWSLKSNTRQHQRVLAFVRAKLNASSTPAERKPYLQACADHGEGRETPADMAYPPRPKPVEWR